MVHYNNVFFCVSSLVFTLKSPDMLLFYQVLLSEIYTDPGGARVVVKELKANASAKEQNDFLQQGDPYR